MSFKVVVKLIQKKQRNRKPMCKGNACELKIHEEVRGIQGWKNSLVDFAS